MHSLYTHLTVRHSTAKELLIIMSFHSRSECQLFGAGCAVQLMTDYFFQSLRKHRLSSQCCGVFCPFSCFVWRNHVWFVSMCWDIVCVCIGHTKHQFVNSPGCAQKDLKESAVLVLRDTGSQAYLAQRSSFTECPQLETVNLPRRHPVLQIAPGDFCPCPLTIPGTRSWELLISPHKAISKGIFTSVYEYICVFHIYVSHDPRDQPVSSSVNSYKLCID